MVFVFLTIVDRSSQIRILHVFNIEINPGTALTDSGWISWIKMIAPLKTFCLTTLLIVPGFLISNPVSQYPIE